MVPIQEHDIEDVANYMACYAFFTLEVHRCPLRIFGDVFRVLERTVTWEAPVAFKAVIQTLFERFPAVLVPARESFANKRSSSHSSKCWPWVESKCFKLMQNVLGGVWPEG